MAHTDLTVFLSGHVHGSWRDDVRKMAEAKDLPITFKGPCEDHGQSDDVGVDIRGISESDVGPGFYPNLKDDLGGRVNNLRNRIWLAKSDVLIVERVERHRGGQPSGRTGYCRPQPGIPARNERVGSAQRRCRQLPGAGSRGARLCLRRLKSTT